MPGRALVRYYMPVCHASTTIGEDQDIRDGKAWRIGLHDVHLLPLTPVFFSSEDPIGDAEQQLRKRMIVAYSTTRLTNTLVAALASPLMTKPNNETEQPLEKPFRSSPARALRSLGV